MREVSLPFLTTCRAKQNNDLCCELQSAKRLLDEKHFEASRLRDESVVKGDNVADLRAQAANLTRDIDCVKHQRAEMWREINHLKEANECKSGEGCQQRDQMKSLDYNLAVTQKRIEDSQRLVDQRSCDLRAKQCALEDTERELARTRDIAHKLSDDCAILRRENDCTQAQNYDAKKNNDFCEARNGDSSVQIRGAELRLKEKEDALFCTRKDNDNMRCLKGQNCSNNADLLAQKDALEKHSAVLSTQNRDLTGELETFCRTDEQLRSQLDRRNRVQGL